jgi:peptidoglycan hydrolase CwlO-like protein
MNKNKANEMHNHKENYHETRIALLEQALINIDKRFDSIDKQFDNLEKSIKELKQEIKDDFRDINNRMWSNFRWLIITMIGFAIGLCGIMAKGFDWFN